MIFGGSAAILSELERAILPGCQALRYIRCGNPGGHTKARQSRAYKSLRKARDVQLRTTMTRDVLLFFAIVCASGFAFLPLHVLLVRARHGLKLLSTINVSIALSAGLGVAFGWSWLGDGFSSESTKAVACLGASLSFIALAGLYSLLGPASVDRSLSAHIVTLLYLAPQREMSEAELFEIYTHADMLEKRFNECAQVKIVERHDKKLKLTKKGSRIAVVYIAMGKLLGIRLWYLDRRSLFEQQDPSRVPTPSASR
jgi:hypothetical protein